MTGSSFTPAELAAAREVLASADPALARVHAETPPLEWRLRDGGFEGLLRMIIEQQVSVASAASVWAKMIAGMGDAAGRITPQALLAHDADALRTFGVSRQKAGYGRDIAQAQIEGRIDLEHMKRLSDEDALAALIALKGVGRWTAEAYLMMCEGRTDVFPGGDVALQEAIRWADQTDERPNEKQAYARAEVWRPYRAVAVHLLWAWYGRVKRGEVAHPMKPATQPR